MLRLYRYNKYGRKVRITLREDGDAYTSGSMDGACRSVARDWGTINSAETIFTEDGMKLMNFDCSGHGGYVLFSHKPLIGFGAEWTSADYSAGIRIPFYVYTFEEDCAWAQLVLSLTPERAWKVARKWNAHRITPSATDTEARDRLLTMARESVARWYPAWTPKVCTI